MPGRKTRSSAFTSAVVIVGIGFAGIGWAAEDCPLIRPAGLSPSDVDRVVVAVLSESLSTEPGRIDRGKTIAALARKGDAPMSYAVFVVSLGESLGFDPATAFYESAQRKGGRQPYESLTIAEFQALSRAAYAQGKDSPPPAMKADAEFNLHRITVRAPSPSGGWFLLRCMTEQIVFQRIETGTGISSAMALTLYVQPFATSREFVEYTRTQGRAALSKLGKLVSLDVTEVPGASSMCAQFKGEAEAVGVPYRIKGRFCYSGKQSRLVYGAMFSHAGDGSVGRFVSEADSFIAGALPK